MSIYLLYLYVYICVYVYIHIYGYIYIWKGIPVSLLTGYYITDSFYSDWLFLRWLEVHSLWIVLTETSEILDRVVGDLHTLLIKI